MKKILATALATVMLCTTFVSAVENPFSDVASDSDLAQSVMWAYENGVTSGTTTTTFEPDLTCTRGQVVTFLWRAQGQPDPTSSENPFNDLTEAWYTTAVLWAVEEGITAGTGEGTFSPDKECSTGEVLTFLYRANGSPDATGEGEYYDDAVNWAVTNGLADTVQPTSPSPRSDIVTYLWKNAGAPAMEVTDPEPVVYTYPDLEYTVPSSEMELSWEYFAEIFEYLALSGAENFAATATGYTYAELKVDEAFIAARTEGYDYALGQHIDILKLYYGYNWSYTSGDNVKLTFKLKYDESIYDSLADVEAEKEVFFAQVSDLVTGFYDSGALKETDSQMVVARYLYDWVCDNTFYGTDTANPYSGYTTLTTGQGVCMGYAGLYNALCRTAGIECYGVGGVAGGGGHTWNYANLDGTWYYIDTTWGDTSKRYDWYFAMTKDELTQTHILDSKWDV